MLAAGLNINPDRLYVDNVGSASAFRAHGSTSPLPSFLYLHVTLSVRAAGKMGPRAGQVATFRLAAFRKTAIAAGVAAFLKDEGSL